MRLRSGGGTTTQRGYGHKHQKLRKVWAKRVAQGDVVCTRCGKLILPESSWHLGHDDYDRTVYTGPEHALCNTLAATRKREATRRGTTVARRRSRAW